MRRHKRLKTRLAVIPFFPLVSNTRTLGHNLQLQRLRCRHTLIVSGIGLNQNHGRQTRTGKPILRSAVKSPRPLHQNTGAVHSRTSLRHQRHLHHHVLLNRSQQQRIHIHTCKYRRLNLPAKSRPLQRISCRIHRSQLQRRTLRHILYGRYIHKRPVDSNRQRIFRPASPVVRPENIIRLYQRSHTCQR